MSISLEKSVRTCSVNTGEAKRIQSDRFLNPHNLICVPWNGLNNKGQEVCPDSQWTKTAGCDSALDRVAVENSQRPKYINYVTLGADGIQGSIYGQVADYTNAVGREKDMMSRNQITGNFGLQWGANEKYQGCSVGAYERNMAQMAQQMRQQNYMQNGSESFRYQNYAGNR